MSQFSNNWFSAHIPAWTRLFGGLGWLDGRALTMVEIGSFEGQCTVWSGDNLMTHPDSRIYCLDTFQGGIEHTNGERQLLRERFDLNIATAGLQDKVTVLEGLSRHGLLSLIADCVQADIVYVDGSHQAPDVLEDLVLSFRVLKTGGLMICDDYLWFQEQMDEGHPRPEDLLNAPKIAIDSFVNIYVRRLHVLQGQPLYQLAFLKLTD